jgi:putative heme-binding domain-containing protein
MRPFLALLLPAALCACAARPGGETPVTPAAPAFEPIFDGRTLAGWDGDPRFWSVEDGAIVGQSSAGTPCTETTYLIWRGGEVGDFELRLQFRLEGGNSGVQFRSRDLGGHRVAGYQADLEDGPSWTGCLYEQDGRGVAATRGESAVLLPGSRTATPIGDPAALLAQVRVHDWNEYVIRAAGERIELEINGTRMLEVADRDPARRSLSGVLAFQLHQGPPMRVAFRDVRLKRLPAGAPPPAAPAARPASAWTGVAPQWIWAGTDTPAGEVVALERRFDVPRPIARATLRTSADNHVRAFVNGELAGEHDAWETALEQDVGALVRRGENALVLVARNDGSQAGAWAELVVEDPAGKRVRVVTDGSWSAARLPDDADFATWTPDLLDRARLGAAHAFGAFGCAPWTAAVPGPAAAPAPEEHEEHALPAAEIELPPGFRAELVHEVRKASEGSWVSLCEDPRGRLYVGDQHGKLYRVTPCRPGAGAETTRVEEVPLAVGSAHGLCWAFDSLYVVVSERDPGCVCGLYRLRDTDGDDQLDSVELLRELAGGGEHGPHAVRLGPDGKLWVVAGNHTDPPEPLDGSRVPRTWGEDLPLPRIDDPRGHAVGRMAPGGWIARTDERGERWEIWAAGLRNAYDVAFNVRGEPFTFDSDMEWDVGTPWYRPTRILHAASGADFGWRNGSGKWPADWPDTWPSACDLGRTSPTGLEFGARARFPERWRDALFACDWAFGTLYAVWLEPSGASYRGTFEPFARGKPFQVTDVLVSHDGELYVTTGGRGTQSALYRITWDGPLDEPRRSAPPLTEEQEARRRLEALHAPRPRTLDELVEIERGLASADRFLAGAARVALEHTPADQWDLVWEACGEEPCAERIVLAALHAGHQAPARVLGALERLVSGTPARRAPSAQKRVTDRDAARRPEERTAGAPSVAVLRLVQLALLRLEVPADVRERLQQRLAQAFPSGDARVDRELALLLARLEAPGVVEALLQRIAQAATQEDKIHFAYCLRSVRSGWTDAQRARFLDFLDGDARAFRGGESLELYLQRIREEFLAGLSDAERAALGPRLAPKAAAAGPAPAAAQFVRRWERGELEALLRAPQGERPEARGRAAFEKARCVTCHRADGQGGSTGPDLTGAGARLGLSDLLDALLEPSKTISDQYQDVEVRTVDGDLLVGRVEGERDGLVVLRRTPGDDRVEIPAEMIEMRRPYPLSRMPTGLLDVLGEDEVLGLFAYVRSR